MLTPDSVGRVYLAAGYTDMRKSIDGLAALVSAVRASLVTSSMVLPARAPSSAAAEMTATASG